MPVLLSHLYRVVQDIQGNIVPDVMGTVTLAGTSTLAALYSDAEGLNPLPNPVVNNAQYASFSLYLNAGHYDMSFNKTGYVFEMLTDILLSEASGGVASLTGTPNQVLVSSTTGDIVLSTPQNLDPDASVQFAHVGLGTPAEAAYALTVQTPSIFRAVVGLSGAPVAGYALTTYSSSSLAANVGINMGTTPLTSTLEVGGTVRAYSNLQVDAAASVATTLSVGQYLGAGGAADSRFSLRSYGTTYLDGLVGIGRVPSYKFEVQGDTYLTGLLGVGTTPNPSWNIVANSILAWTQLQSSGTLYVVGAATMASSVLMQGAVTVNTGITGTGGINVTPFVTTNQGNIQQNLGAGGNADLGYAFRAYGPSYFDASVGFASVPVSAARVIIGYNKATQSGLAIQQTVQDDGNASVLFLNNGGGICGTITTSSTTTAYNTTSDRRAKEAIVPLQGSLPVVQALRPVAFRWRATGEAGVGFVADEVQSVVPEAVSGTPDGEAWQGMDLSKLLPYVVGALHSILTRLETMETAYARAD